MSELYFNLHTFEEHDARLKIDPEYRREWEREQAVQAQAGPTAAPPDDVLSGQDC